MRSHFAGLLVSSFCVALTFGIVACGDDGGGVGGVGGGGGGAGGAGGDAGPPNEAVRARIESLAPSANIGHRGTGPTRPQHALPENSISSFLAAMEEGADGIELDVEITVDGRLVIMHDDTVDRTTDCTGCVSKMTFDEVRACSLLDGADQPTEEHPPTLDEVYAAVPSPALINVELKVFEEPDCVTDTTGPEALVPLAVDEVTRLAGQSRTLFSSFDPIAADLVKQEQPEYYSALLLRGTNSDDIDEALLLDQDAIHPFLAIDGATVQEALDAGLQVNVWTVNFPEDMQANIDKGATALITDQPGVLADLLSD